MTNFDKNKTKMKRYCQILTLPDDEKAIKAYVEAHSRVWPEIKEGIRSVGILDMQIYLHGHTSFMIMDTVNDFDWERTMQSWLPCPDRLSGKHTSPSSKAATPLLLQQRNGN